MLNSYTLLVSIIILSCTWKPCQQRQDTDCLHRCGSINIPYPFGIGPDGKEGCYLNPNFTVSCNVSSSSPTPILKKFDLEIVEIQRSGRKGSVGSLIVKIPTLSTCSRNNNSTEAKWTSKNLTDSPFRFAEDAVDGNVFASVGCDGYAVFYNETSGMIAGCTSVCSPDYHSAAAVAVSRSKCYGYRCCQVQLTSVHKHFPELKQYGISVRTTNTSGLCRSAFLIGKKYLEAGPPLAPGITAVPVVLKWGKSNLTFIYIFVTMIIVVGIPIIICGGCWGWWRFKTKKRRKEIKLRAMYFKDKLDILGASNIDTAERTKLFTLTELKRFTDNFSKDRVLGQGGQGTVYKGMLKNGQVIAVKRSRALEESQWKQFINEVILLSQIKHRHVVKILGCCLEDDKPLVVYEFICNGTLLEHIHKSIFTWEMRLRIAFETASAISYLHSEFSTPIYHRDIKSSNVLLDDKFGAKLSDFGISRAVSVEQTHVTTCIQGTFGYLDPEYFFSSQYSEKSDVYSFGVILVELLTGEKPIRTPILVDKEEDTEDDEELSLVIYFVSSIKDSTLFDIVDPMIIKDGKKKDIMEFANLAKQCLSHKGIQRPTMKEVTMVLERLRYKNSSC
ncbi:wall-associated receptor kinase-like 3 [Chenopodium quinoa]|uniref:wall-associated receptor kinase-like 3 n=1 Tax=Chenopodium quinoa TaxID=63459 RepID=UPI000B78DF22|nr:wall-associated receptor kinase-like 3 [Chenopodium quinoa]